MSIEQNQPMLMGRYKSWTGSTPIANFGSNEKQCFKLKLFDVCADFTKVSLEIRVRVISWGLIIFYVDPSWAIRVDPVRLLYLPNAYDKWFTQWHTRMTV